MAFLRDQECSTWQLEELQQQQEQEHNYGMLHYTEDKQNCSMLDTISHYSITGSQSLLDEDALWQMIPNQLMTVSMYCKAFSNLMLVSMWGSYCTVCIKTYK